jgi:hypothetical protein
MLRRGSRLSHRWNTLRCESLRLQIYFVSTTIAAAYNGVGHVGGSPWLPAALRERARSVTEGLLMHGMALPFALESKAKKLILEVKQ